MKKTTILYGMIFSGVLFSGASAQESRSELLKEQEKILKEEVSLKKTKIEAGVGKMDGNIDKFLKIKELLKISKTLESKIKTQKDLIALWVKQEEVFAIRNKNGLASDSDLMYVQMEILKAKTDLFVLQGDKAEEKDREKLFAEVEKLGKKVEDSNKQRMGGGLINIEENLRSKIGFAELLRDLSRAKEDRIKYQKELVALWGQLQTVLADLYKNGLGEYRVDVKLALVEAKLKLLDLEEGK